MSKIDLKSMTLPELCEALGELGEPKFRAKQIFSWIHQKKVRSFDEMTNLSLKLRESCKEHFSLPCVKLVERYDSKLDGTIKFLFELEDGEYVECVLMDYHHGTSICISSQVGCKMGCKFCASTIAGFVRHLTPAEMLDQVYEAERQSGKKIGSIVMMGIGEPLDNFDHVVKFLNLISDPDGMNLSLRHLSLSTCGLVPQIDKLSEYNYGLTLSVSLHAPNDEIRRQTMPVAMRYPMEELLDACRRYTDTTHRRISFEYALIHGVNDKEEHARELARKLRGMLCHVNLIPVNPVKETDFRPSDQKYVLHFQKLLVQLGVNTTIRRTLGQDINAACGQLRRNRLEMGK